MTQTIRVTKPTKNVLTSTTLDDFYFHSDYPLLKVFSMGSFSMTSSFWQNDNTITINHNLGYQPYVIVFSQMVYDVDGSRVPLVTTEYYQHDWTQKSGFGAPAFAYTSILANTITINVGTDDADFGATINGFYYIFYDPTV